MTSLSFSNLFSLFRKHFKTDYTFENSLSKKYLTTFPCIYWKDFCGTHVQIRESSFVVFHPRKKKNSFHFQCCSWMGVKRAFKLVLKKISGRSVNELTWFATHCEILWQWFKKWFQRYFSAIFEGHVTNRPTLINQFNRWLMNVPPQTVLLLWWTQWRT